jgi:thioesterase domain-containing protein
VKVPTFLAMLRDRDIQVSAEGEQLRCNAPAGVLTPELHGELRRRKDEILDFLHMAGALARQQRGIVPLQPRGGRPPIFAVAGHNGDVFCYRALARHLGEDQPFFGLQPPGLDGQGEPLARIEELASYFAAEIQAFQPAGPYVIAGFCAGGTLAFELARQLFREGGSLSFLALFGAPYPTSYRLLPQLRKRFTAQLERLVKHARTLAALSPGERRLYLTEKLRNRKPQPAVDPFAASDPVLAQRAKVERATFTALRHYVPQSLGGPLNLFLPSKEWARSRDQPLRWRTLATQAGEYFGPTGCNSDIMLREPNAATFAELFRASTAPSPRGKPNAPLRPRAEDGSRPRSIPTVSRSPFKSRALEPLL